MISLGRRVRNHSDDRLGTVLFIGDVFDGNGCSLGERIGVEWDDPGGGRHSGSLFGVKYFHPLYDKQSESGCSFVKRESLCKPREFWAVLEELHPIEERVSLDHSNVATAAENSEMFPGVKSLDLSFCLIEKFSVFVKIISSFPNLQSLHLNGNRFCLDWDGLIEGVRTLSLAACVVAVTRLVEKFSQLETLVLSRSRLDGDLFAWKNLSTLVELYLDNGCLDAMSSFVLRDASILPNLRYLNLSSNKIERMVVENHPNLKKVVFDDCLIRATCDLIIPDVDCISCLGNEFYEKGARAAVIFLYPWVKILNSTLISEQERLDARKEVMQNRERYLIPAELLRENEMAGKVLDIDGLIRVNVEFQARKLEFSLPKSLRLFSFKKLLMAVLLSFLTLRSIFPLIVKMRSKSLNLIV